MANNPNLQDEEKCSVEMLCLNLTNTFVGNDYRVISLKECGKFRNKINGMGVYKNSIIKILKNDKHYPIKIAVGNARIAFGREIAGKILVTKVEKDE